MIYKEPDFRQLLLAMVQSNVSDLEMVDAFIKILQQDREAVKGELLYLLEPREGTHFKAEKTTFSEPISDVVINSDPHKYEYQNELLDELRAKVEELYE